MGKVRVEAKKLNQNEQGIVIKIDSAQKAQLSLNKIPFDIARAWLIERAGQLADGSKTVEEVKAER